MGPITTNFLIQKSNPNRSLNSQQLVLNWQFSPESFSSSPAKLSFFWIRWSCLLELRKMRILVQSLDFNEEYDHHGFSADRQQHENFWHLNLNMRSSLAMWSQEARKIRALMTMRHFPIGDLRWITKDHNGRSGDPAALWTTTQFTQQKTIIFHLFLSMLA